MNGQNLAKVPSKVPSNGLRPKTESTAKCPNNAVRDPGVLLDLLDTELSVKQQISKTASYHFYQIRRSRLCSRLIVKEVSAQTAASEIPSQLLADLPPLLLNG